MHFRERWLGIWADNRSWANQYQVIKTRNILRKIVNAGAAEICLYLCSYIPDITRHKSINVSKRIKTLEVSETFDPLWSLLRGTQHLNESALMICRPQVILNFIVSILSIGLFSQSMSDRSNLILHLAILWCSLFFHGVCVHLSSFELDHATHWRSGSITPWHRNRERYWSTYMNMAVSLTKLKISSSQSSFLNLSCLHVSELFRILFPFHYNS